MTTTKPLTLSVKRELKPNEVEDFVGLLYSQVSCWLREVQYLGDGSWQLTIEDPAEEDKRLVKVLTEKQILKGVKKGHDYFCCAEDLEQDELGMGCALDADIAFQFALYGELVYG